jgi:hypothetical protein
MRFGQATALALGRYLRARAKDSTAIHDGLWVAEKRKGPLLATGISQMLRRRGPAVGVVGLLTNESRRTPQDGGQRQAVTAEPTRALLDERQIAERSRVATKVAGNLLTLPEKRLQARSFTLRCDAGSL